MDTDEKLDYIIRELAIIKAAIVIDNASGVAVSKPFELIIK